MTDAKDAWTQFLRRQPPTLADLHAHPPADVLPLPDGREVTVERLVGVLRAQTADPPQERGPRPFRDDRAGAAMLAAAWRHITFRQARAVLALFDAGLRPEAQANARACLEHAVVLQRLALAADDDATGPLLEELARQQQKRQRKHLDYLEELDASGGGQHRTLLEETRRQHDSSLPADGGPAPDVRTVASHFGGIPNGRHFYSVYGRLSENSHAGFTSAVPFLFRAARSGEPVSPRPEPVAWAEALALVCWSCWAADDALRRFLPDDDDPAARHVALLASVGIAAS